MPGAILGSSANTGRWRQLRWVFYWVALAAGFLVLLWRFRHTPYVADPLLDGYLEVAGSLIAFTYAANALIRFRGAHDRLSLMLAFGFVLCGLIEMGSTMSSYRSAISSEMSTVVPLAWMVSRTLLAVLLVAALLVEKHVPVARDPAREIAVATLIVGIVAYLTSAAYFAVPGSPAIHPNALMARPWEFLPAAIFLVAAIGYWQRLARVDSSLDRALCIAAGLNVACHLAISQSGRWLDAPFVCAHFLKVTSYAIVLGGALLDNARLFDQVSHLATSDSLTGLANYRRLLDVMNAEIQRSRRTRRSFAVVLLDLDGLKKINDQHGHLVGSRALKRLAYVLRANSRSMDTPARYGGDEFALVLPEAGGEAAAQVAARICERLANDGQEPAISVSAGLAVFPRDGSTIEKLLGTADRALYAMKARGDKKFRWEQIAACL